MGYRVLVVDDDETTCELLQLTLRRLGHTAVIETSAERALDVARDSDCDVILSDITMGSMDGFELCRRAHD